MDQNSVYGGASKGKYFRLANQPDGSVKLVPVKVPSHIKEEKLRRKKKRETAKAVSRNREKAFAMDIKTVLFLAIGLAICGVVCSLYISAQQRVKVSMNKVSRLKVDIETLAATNNETETRLSIASDLNQVSDTAVNKLGMVSVTKKQIKYYSLDNSDYLYQYSKVN